MKGSLEAHRKNYLQQQEEKERRLKALAEMSILRRKLRRLIVG